jgi:hypothetical protein
VALSAKMKMSVLEKAAEIAEKSFLVNNETKRTYNDFMMSMAGRSENPEMPELKDIQYPTAEYILELAEKIEDYIDE